VAQEPGVLAGFLQGGVAVGDEPPGDFGVGEEEKRLDVQFRIPEKMPLVTFAA
jgi:hypothetical protein